MQGVGVGVGVGEGHPSDGLGSGWLAGQSTTPPLTWIGAADKTQACTSHRLLALKSGGHESGRAG